MMRKYLAVEAVLLSLTLVLSGCHSGKTKSARSTVSSSTANLASQSIEDNTTSSSDSESSISSSNSVSSTSRQNTSNSKILSVKNTVQVSSSGWSYISGWLDDNSFLHAKSTVTFNKAGSLYPFTINLYNTTTGKDSVTLAEKGKTLECAIYSPGRNYMAYESRNLSPDNVGYDLYIVNVKTQSKKLVMKGVSSYQWIDSNRLLVSILWSNYVIDVSGNTTDLSKKTGVYYNHADIALIGNQFYYLEIGETSLTGGDFYVLDMTTGHKNLLMHYVRRFDVSPDKKCTLIATNDGTKTVLEVTDRNGKVEQTIMRTGNGVFTNEWWSPDGRTVAYSIIGNIRAEGLYLFDIKTGVSTKIDSNVYGSSNLYNPDVVWSPSGDKVAMSVISKDEFVCKVFYLQ